MPPALQRAGEWELLMPQPTAAAGDTFSLAWGAAALRTFLDVFPWFTPQQVAVASADGDTTDLPERRSLRRRNRITSNVQVRYWTIGRCLDKLCHVIIEPMFESLCGASIQFIDGTYAVVPLTPRSPCSLAERGALR